MTDKYRYIIYPDRTYIIECDGEKVEVQGQDISNMVPDLIRQKYVQSLLDYDRINFYAKSEE